jgi:hypothetical protein
VPAEEKPADTGPEQREPDVDSPEVSPPESDFDWPSGSESDDDSSSSDWVVVIGGMAVLGTVGFAGLAAAAAVLVNRAKKKRLEKGDQQDLPEDEVVGYILQLSTDEIKLKVNEVQPVAIDCFQVAADGSYKPAPHASIQIQPPPASSFIKVWPLSGQGSLDVHIQLDGMPQENKYQVVVYASGGGHSTSATITVTVERVMLSLTTPEDRRTLAPGEEEGLWACASLETDPPNPDFNSDQENAKIIFEVKGPNADWIDAGQEGENVHGKWVYLLARAPSPGATLTPGNPTLLAKYLIGKTWLVEELKLELHAEYELKLELFDVPKTSDITYISKAGEWQASALLVYWVNANEGKTPVDPGFEYGFPDPPIQVDPPVLHVKSSDGFEVHTEHQYLLKFEVDQDLEPYFGEELTDNDGMVRLVVEAIDSEGQSYTAEMDYQLRPEAIQMIYYWEDSPEARLEGEREHNGIPLKLGELLAYEKDEIGVGAFLVRADQAENFYTAYDQRLQLSGEPQAELRGEKSWTYLLKPEEEGEGLNRYAARIQAKEIEFYTGKEEPFEVRVELSLDESRYPNYYKPYPPQTKIKIDPLHIFLKLWVFPGIQTGTSLAGALMYLPSKGVGLRDFALTMDIQSKGSRLTTDQAVQKTDGEGLARWTLSYQGMNWNNYRSSYFTVRCGVPKPKGGFKGTQVQIDIGKNVDTFVADVYQQRNSPALNLDNPDFKTGSGFMATVADFAWPDFLCGPINNVVDMVTSNYDTYTCSNLAYRIIKWWGALRNGKNNYDENKITSMNGIDMAQYLTGLIPGAPHTFAGIFLANADKTPTDDPRFIDPWWIQNWSARFRRRVNGLYTKANQYTMQAGLYAAVALLALLVLKFTAWLQGPAVAMAVKTRVMGILFGGGGGWAWAAYQGITVYSDGHLQGKNYLQTQDFDYSYDSIPNACDLLKQKGVPAVKPIVEW